LARFNFLTFTLFYGGGAGGFCLGEKFFGTSTVFLKALDAFFTTAPIFFCIKVVEQGLELTLQLIRQAGAILGLFPKCAFKIAFSSEKEFTLPDFLLAFAF
jgi:hypothetical protein